MKAFNYYSATFTIKQDHVIRCTNLYDKYYNDIIVHSELFFKTDANLHLDSSDSKITNELFFNSCWTDRAHHVSPTRITFAAAIPDYNDCDYPIGSSLRSDNSSLKFAEINIDLINDSLSVEGNPDFIEAYYKFLFGKNTTITKSNCIKIDTIPDPYTDNAPLDAYTAISAFTTAIQIAAMKINKLDKPLLKFIFYKKDVKDVLSDLDDMVVHDLKYTDIHFISAPIIYKQLSIVNGWKNSRCYDYADMVKNLHLKESTTESDQE